MKKIKAKIISALETATPRGISKNVATRRAVKKLADSLGLVYFGYVDQREDDHRLMRGLTVSSTHSDNHYTVGTFKTYDIAFTIRKDSLVYPDKRIKNHFWTILTVDLHTPKDIPHFYVSHHKIKEELLARYSSMSKLQLGAYAPYPEDFVASYDVFASQEHSLDVQQIVTPQLSTMFMQHFDDMSIEISENTVYLYKTEKFPTKPQLEKMLNSGIWIAQIIDMQRNS